MTPEEIKEFRKKYNVSQRLLAEIAGISCSSICRYESGERNPQNSIVLKLEKAMKYLEKRQEFIDETLERWERVKRAQKIQDFYNKYNHYEEKHINKGKKIFDNLFWSVIIILLFYFFM